MGFFDKNEFSFDKDSGFGGFSVDSSGSFDLPGLGGSGALSPGGINRYVDASYSNYPSGSTDSFSKILDALNKANAFKAQSSSAGSSRGMRSGGQGKFEKINDTLSIYTPAPKVKQTGGSSGGPGFGDVGNIIGTAGTALGIFGPLGPLVAGGIGKTIDAFA